MIKGQHKYPTYVFSNHNTVLSSKDSNRTISVLTWNILTFLPNIHLCTYLCPKLYSHINVSETLNCTKFCNLFIHGIQKFTIVCINQIVLSIYFFSTPQLMIFKDTMLIQVAYSIHEIKRIILEWTVKTRPTLNTNTWIVHTLNQNIYWINSNII